MLNENGNPWSVADLDAFQYYCCPECDERESSKENFLQHALNNHPKSQQYFGKENAFKYSESNEFHDNFQIKNELIEEEKDLLEGKIHLSRTGFEPATSQLLVGSFRPLGYDKDDPEIQETILKCDIKEEQLMDSIPNDETIDPLNAIENDKNINTKSQTEIDQGIPKTLIEILCKFCHAKFKNHANLNKHTANVHNEHKYEYCGPMSNIQGQIVHTCIFCGKYFDQKSLLRTHIDTVHEDKKHKCEKCEKSFILLVNLQKHIKFEHKRLQDYKNDNFHQGAIKILKRSKSTGKFHIA